MKDLFSLFRYNADVMRKAGLKTKTYTEFQTLLRAAIAKTPDYQVLGSLGISDLGPARAKQILKFYKGDWDQFTQDVISYNNAGVIQALGWNIGSKVTDYLNANKWIGKDMQELKEHMETFSSTKDYDLRIGHTGFTPSQALRDFCEQRNMELVDGKSFDILIADSLNSASGKMQVARKKNLPIFTESLFLKQYEDYGKPAARRETVAAPFVHATLNQMLARFYKQEADFNESMTTAYANTMSHANQS